MRNKNSIASPPFLPPCPKDDAPVSAANTASVAAISMLAIIKGLFRLRRWTTNRKEGGGSTNAAIDAGQHKGCLACVSQCVDKRCHIVIDRLLPLVRPYSTLIMGHGKRTLIPVKFSISQIPAPRNNRFLHVLRWKIWRCLRSEDCASSFLIWSTIS